MLVPTRGTGTARTVASSAPRAALPAAARRALPCAPSALAGCGEDAVDVVDLTDGRAPAFVVRVMRGVSEWAGYGDMCLPCDDGAHRSPA